MNRYRYSSRGRHEAHEADAQKRTYCVSVRLSAREAELLDDRRKTMQRGTYLRLCLLDKLPPVIPPLNIKVASNLGRSLGNLSTVATAMRSGKYIEDSQVMALIKDLRLSLVTSYDLEEKDEE